jgi:hypothetical protein
MRPSWRQQEPVGGHEIDRGVARPTRQQCLEHTRGRALPHGDAAGHADDERNTLGIGAEKDGRCRMEIPRRGHEQVQQPRQRQIDVCDLVERHRLVDADKRSQLRFGQRQRRRRPQTRPLGTRERLEWRHRHALVRHEGHGLIVA